MTEFDSLVSSILSVSDVEYVSLGTILDYEQPGSYIVKSTDYVESGTPVLTAGQSFLLGYTEETEGICHASKDHPVIIFDDFTTSFHYVDFDFKVKSSAMKILRSRDGSSLSLKYAYHCMKLIDYAPQEHARQWISTYSDFEIPMPNSDIQKAIVEILDSFEGLVTNCQRELNLRLIQKSHLKGEYINSLSLDNGVKSVKLKDVVVFTRNTIPISSISPEQYIGVENLVSGGGLVVNTKLPKMSSCLSFVKGDVLIGNIRPYLRKIFLADIDGGTNGDVVIVSPNRELILPEYLYHLLNTDQFFDYDNQYAKGGKMPRGDKDMIAEYSILLPPLDVQREITSNLAIVDRFIETLRKEKDSRLIQYEEYRNYLLAFGE